MLPGTNQDKTMDNIMHILINDPMTHFGLAMMLPIMAIPVMDYLANKVRAISTRRQWRLSLIHI